MAYEKIPTSVQSLMNTIKEKCGDKNAARAKIFESCFANTLQTTVKKLDDGTTYVLTGDIPAMWLRKEMTRYLKRENDCYNSVPTP